MVDMLIKNGNVVFEEDTYPADILVRDGKIVSEPTGKFIPR